MNDADRSFINEHKSHVLKTLEIISSAVAETEPGEAARIGVATLLMNVYSGMEVILRHIMEDRGVKIPKTGAWHKEVLATAMSMEIISAERKGKNQNAGIPRQRATVRRNVGATQRKAQQARHATDPGSGTANGA